MAAHPSQELPLLQPSNHPAASYDCDLTYPLQDVASQSEKCHRPLQPGNPPSTSRPRDQHMPPHSVAARNMQLYKGDDTEEDVHENNATGTSTPILPNISAMDHVTGYEGVDFEGGSLIPPPVDVQTATQLQEEPSDVQPLVPTISEDDARRALYEEVSEHCCYGLGAVENLVISNIHSSSAFHYQLETFTEGRETSWAYEPYNGQEIDGPENGQAPSAWVIDVQPDSMFLNHEKSYEVPHTASVKICTNCSGAGMNRCWMCLGCGMVICGSCNGNGCHLRIVDHYVSNGDQDDGDSHSHVQVVPCLACNCSGTTRCLVCLGCGQLQCKVCNTHGKLKFYIKLTVMWTTHKNDHVVERTALPEQLICGAEGRVAFKEQCPRVAPVITFPDQAVNEASRQLIRSHSVSFPTQKILMQRHWIRIVPVSEVLCDYKGTMFSYWVYGDENLVFNPDYPQQCCCGCTIL